MIKHNRNIKKLSTAIRRGLAIAQERGIKVARGAYFKRNKKGEITSACALGLASIGVYGEEDADVGVMAGLPFKFKVNSIFRNQCVVAAFKIASGTTLTSMITLANDSRKWSPSKIADKLESCGL
jgi:hypothetical protein